MRNDLAHIRDRAESPWIRVLFILAILALAFAAGNARATDVPFTARKTIDGSFDGDHSVVAATQGSCSVVVWGAHGEDFGQRNVPDPNTDFVKVSAATWGHHILGLKSDGSIVAWGQSNYGQCNVPLPNSGFVEIAGVDNSSLGLKADGSIVAWGINDHGQCNVPAPNTGFMAVAGGLFHCLGLKSSGSIAAWGENGDGQCNVPSPNTGFIAVSAGGHHSVGLKSDGSVVAWGRNDYGQCNVPVPNTGFRAVDADGDHCLGLKTDGSVVAWGRNNFGQCNVPLPSTGFVAVAAGAHFSLGLKSDGSVIAWGENDQGQCTVPAPNTGFVAIAAGANFGVALSPVGGLPAQPVNLYPPDLATNQPLEPNLSSSSFVDPDLGDTHAASQWQVRQGWNRIPSDYSVTVFDSGADTTDLTSITLPAGILTYNTPYNWRVRYRDITGAWSAWSQETMFTTRQAALAVMVWGAHGEDFGQRNVPEPNIGFMKVAASTWGHHILGLRSDGSIVAWGQSNYGQCNLPSPNSGFAEVAGADNTSLALKADGSIVAWGLNDHGQCNVPAPNTGFMAVAGGLFHCLGLKSGGSIAAWGENGDGQCSVPSPNSGFKAVSAGGHHSVGLKSDGSVVAWGRNDYGQCSVPAPNTGFRAVDADGDHCLGLKTDGSVVAWGRNNFGQCNVPLPNTDFVAVAAGAHFSLGLKSDGSVIAWGENDQGQCTVPSPNTGFVAIAAGANFGVALSPVGFLPDQPVNLYPPDLATNQPLEPNLSSSAFTDPDAGDTHAASQWQVRQGWDWIPSDYSVTVFDSGADTTHLTSITLPVTLTWNTPYKWRVRYRDSQVAWSAWSQETMFTTGQAALSADRVVFDADGDINMLDPARPGAVQLTTGADRDTCPRFDPTGGRIAFSSDRGGPFRIWVMRSDGTDLRAISGFEQGNPIALDWSPDGNSFVAGALGSTWWRVAGDGSGATLLKEHTLTQARHAAWSTADWIAYQISPYGNATASSIRKMTGAGASDAELLPDAVTPAWSADGSKLLYGQGGDIWVCNADGTGKVNRTNTTGDTETAPAWSSNDAKIYYRLSPSGNPGVSHVYMANADGSGAVSLYYTNAQIGTLDTALVQVGTNEPPLQPVNQSPDDETTGVLVVPTLQASPFEDPDAGDTHASSHWQVRLFNETYETAVVNDTSTVELTSYEVVPGVLVPGQKYAWRVRYSDNHGNPSSWSAETVFTTFAPPPPDDRVVIVAGGGDFEGNAIVDQTKFLAGYAYRVSRARGIPESNIRFLSNFEGGIDADGNGTDDVDGAATRAMLLDTLSTTSAFLSGTSKLILYMVDHGSRQGNDWYFQVNPTEQVTADEVDGALDALQDTNPSLKVALVVDFCYAGGFVLKCQPNLGQFRVCVSGATHESLAVFSGSSAGVSFSNFFFDCLAAGHNFNSAFRVARNGILAGYFGPPSMPLVVPWLEDNWDGFISDKNDGEKAKDLYWGNTSAYGATPPRILSVTPAQTLAPGQRSLELVVELDAGHTVERVWAIITPPWATYSEGVPVSDVIEVELSKQIGESSSRLKMATAGEQPLSSSDTQVWKATYYGFLPYPTGSYRVSFYAQGNDGDPANSQIALPQTVIITPEQGRTPAGALAAWSLYE